MCYVIIGPWHNNCFISCFFVSDWRSREEGTESWNKFKFWLCLTRYYAQFSNKLNNFWVEVKTILFFNYYFPSHRTAYLSVEDLLRCSSQINIMQTTSASGLEILLFSWTLQQMEAAAKWQEHLYLSQKLRVAEIIRFCVHLIDFALWKV